MATNLHFPTSEPQTTYLACLQGVVARIIDQHGWIATLLVDSTIPLKSNQSVQLTYLLYVVSMPKQFIINIINTRFLPHEKSSSRGEPFSLLRPKFGYSSPKQELHFRGKLLAKFWQCRCAKCQFFGICKNYYISIRTFDLQ